MGALKGRWQCLRGLRVNINSKHKHRAACRWITIAIILHNLVIDVEGAVQGEHFAGNHSRIEEVEDRGTADLPRDNGRNYGEAKRQQLVEELLAFRQM